MNKQQVRQVHKLFGEHMCGIGAASREWELGTEYTISTPSGPATVHLIDSVRRGGIPWLACRFEDPGKARANGLDCNPYSGKYNCHVGNDPARTVEELAAVFVDHLDRMTTTGRCANAT